VTARVEIYRERLHPGIVYPAGMTYCLGKWRWRFVKNGRIMADSGQGYSRRIDCLNGCASVLGGECWNGNPTTTYIERVTGRVIGVHTERIPVVDLTREAKS
jgi:hypothetical protein